MVRRAAASQTQRKGLSTHAPPCSPRRPPPASEKQKCLHTSPNVPWGTWSPLAEILVAWDSVPLASCGERVGVRGVGRRLEPWETPSVDGYTDKML